MPILSPFNKVIDRVRKITADANGIYWPTSELEDYINEGQEEYCEKTKTLRAEAPLTTRENSQIYNLPVDCYTVTRLERGDGNSIKKSSSTDLMRMFGPKFRNDSGTPEYYYQDLDGELQLRFYPNPSDDLRASYETFDSDLGGIISSDDDLAVAETYDSELGEVVDTDQEDDEAYDTFNFDEGIITGVLNTASKMRAFYIRSPRLDCLEIRDIQALQYYTLHKCYEKDGPYQDVNKSSYYENKFQERINRESTRVESAYHAELSVRGSYV